MAYVADKGRHPQETTKKLSSGFCLNLLTFSRFVSFQEKLCPVDLFGNMLIVSGE